MENVLEGRERNVGKLFSAEYRYRVPEYQRPYAWETEQAENLFEDTYAASQNKQEAYFLGSAVFVKDGSGRLEIVDGQQRLSTIAILLAVLITSLPAEEQTDKLKGLLYDTEGYFANNPRTERIVLRSADHEIFSHVLMLELAAIEQRLSTSLTESQRRIQNNAARLSELVSDSFGDDSQKQIEYIGYLLDRCYMVTVTSSSLPSAFRMFTVLNSRGLDLSPVDLVKSNLFGALPASQRATFSATWDNAENEIGSAGMNETLAHLRFILNPVKQKTSIYEEINALIGPELGADIFLEDWFLPATRAYAVLSNPDTSFPENDPCQRSLKWLRSIGNTDWMPIAMLQLMRSGQTKDLAPFFAKLERLAAYLQTTGKNVNKRLRRYGGIIREMLQNSPELPAEDIRSLNLTADEQADFLETLQSDLYLMPHNRCKYVLLRLNEAVSDGLSQPITNGKGVTIEHVLPQNPPDSSEWNNTWSMDEQHEWLHKIANLALLSRPMNSEAQNADFEEKKSKYAAGKNGTTSFPLTVQVLNEPEWTPDVVRKRQESLVATLKTLWQLK